MRVAACYSFQDVVVEERPVPDLGPGDLLVRVEVCGLCGSDLSKLTPVNTGRPLVLGHEMTGTVLEKGPEVRGFEVGQRVVAGHHAPCFECHFCRRGNYSMCPTFKGTNLDPGGFSEFVRVPSLNVRHVTYTLPEELSFEEGSFTEPLACCLRALRRCPIQPGDVAVVLGLGSVGQLMVQLFKVQDLFAAGADPMADRRKMARRLGADLAGSPADEGFANELLERTEGRGPDLVVTATENPKALSQALNLVRDGGTVNIFGGLSEPLLELNIWNVYRREITLMASYSSSPREFPDALELLRTRRVRVAEMVTHRFPLAGLGQAIEGMRKAVGLKNIIHPNT